MSHLIMEHDQMISGRNITPWHRLGEVTGEFNITDLYRIMGWPVHMEQLFTSKGEPTNSYCTIRTNLDSNERIVLGTGLSKDYKILQNSEMIQVIEPLVDAGCSLETAGTLKNGQRVWTLLRLSSQMVVGENDVINKYILASNDHTGKEAVKFGLVGVRIVCNNTLTLAEFSGGSQLIRIRHEGDVASTLSRVASMLDHVNGQFLSYEQQLNQLAQMPVEVSDLRKYVKEIFFPKMAELPVEDQGIEQRKLLRLQDQIENAFLTAPGSNLDTAKGTAYGAYQAVNYFLNHEKKIGESRRLPSLAWGQSKVYDQRALVLAGKLTK